MKPLPTGEMAICTTQILLLNAVEDKSKKNTAVASEQIENSAP